MKKTVVLILLVFTSFILLSTASAAVLYSGGDIVIGGSLADGRGILGDVNGDGDIDFRDAILTLKYSAGLKSAVPADKRTAADVNKDGRIDFSDAALILKYDAGLAALCRKNIVVMGDSIYGNARDSTGVCAVIGRVTKANVINCAFGGTRGSRRSERNTGYDLFDAPALIFAVINNDFTAQENAVEAYGLGNAYKKALDNLRSLADERSPVRWEDVDMILINWGTNDYAGGVETETFTAAMQSNISSLRTVANGAMIAVASPTWRGWSYQENENSEEYLEYDSNTRKFVKGDDLPTLIAAEQAAAAEMDVPFINCYDIGMDEHNYTEYYYPNTDSPVVYPKRSRYTHFNAAGREKLGTYVAKQLSALAAAALPS